MISKIVFFREFRILETGTCISYISQLSDDCQTVTANNISYLSQVSKLKQISIQLQLLIHGIVMKQQNIWVMSNISSNSLSVRFPLKHVLSYSAPKPSNNYFTLPRNAHGSNIQGGNGFYWTLESYPSGNTETDKDYYSIFLRLCYCSFHYAEVQTKFSIQCVENNKTSNATYSFGVDASNTGWSKFMTCKEANQLKSITFIANIEILGVKLKENNPLEISDESYIANMLSQFKHEEMKQNINLLPLKQEQKR
eukprot:171391_1